MSGANERYLEMFKADQLFDKKSLVWENNTLEIINDKYDAENVPEGRMGEFKIKRILTELGVVILFPVINETEEIFLSGSEEDNSDFYQLSFDKRFFKIEKMSKAEHGCMIKELENSGTMIKCINDKNPVCISEYEGFYYTENYGDMIGRVSSFVDKEEGVIYNFTYAGKGNYTDIKMEGSFILNRIIKQIA